MRGLAGCRRADALHASLVLKRFPVSRVKEVQHYLLFVWINRLQAQKHESMSRPTKGWATPAPSAAPHSAIPGASRGDSNVIRECVEGVRKSDRWGSILFTGGFLALVHNNPDVQCKGVERAKAHMKITHRLLRNMAVLSHMHRRLYIVCNSLCEGCDAQPDR